MTITLTPGTVRVGVSGLAPALPNDATKYLDGTGAYSTPAGGGGGSGLIIQEADGSPIGTATTLVVPNGTLSYSGGTATYTPAGGGGGVSHSYAGHNSIGASHAGMTQYSVYATKVTLAADGLISSVGAYFTETGTHVGALTVAVFADNAGSLDQLLAMNVSPPTSFIPAGASFTPQPGWRHLAIGLWVTAGDYWLGIQDPSGNPLELYYDVSGSDGHYNPGAWLADGGAYTWVPDSLAYCIRADFLS